MKQVSIFAAGIAVGAAALAGVAAWSGGTVLSWHAGTEPHDHGPAKHSHSHGDNDTQDMHEQITLTDEQVAAAGIVLAQARGGELRQHILVPGTITADADKTARVAVRLVGTVAELPKRLGGTVEKGDVVAVIESREVADAKSEYLAARLTNDLQQLLAGRQKNLWDSRATSENDYLRARLTAQDAQIRLDSARQKLFALGLEDSEIAALPEQPVETLRRQVLRSPIRGRVAERRVDLGALVGREGQESELFVIVDLDQVWVELAVSPGDIPKISEGKEIKISSGTPGPEGKAAIIFLSPLLDKETRNARIIASLANPGHVWRPGSFVTAEVPFGGEAAKIVIPRQALQTVHGEVVVFVRDGDAFEVNKVKIGREDDDQVEIVDGLNGGEFIAIANTFILKAELGKSEAEHQH